MATSQNNKDNARRINRRATKEEQAQHDKEHPQIMRGIQDNHRRTQLKVRKMTNSILLNDRG